MLNKVCLRIHKQSKFRIFIPKDYEEAVALDKLNSNTLLQDATKKEMIKVEVAFKFNEDGTVPIGFQKITCHLIYGGGGHLTSIPVVQSYSSVVSRILLESCF